MSEEHVQRQRAFYETREHAHLQARADDRYARKLAGRLARALGLGREQRVLEVGAGFGRFSFELLEHCGELVALDLSERALAELEATRDERGIDPARCRTRVGDVDAIAPGALGEPFDCVLGFFFLHHLPNAAHTIAALRPLVRPGGGIGFVEPNRRNPLFALQVLACPDMSWAEEKGMFALSARGIESAYAAAGFEARATERFGFFPPQLLNRSERAARSERWIEARALLRPLPPFLLLTARNPADEVLEAG